MSESERNFAGVFVFRNIEVRGDLIEDADSVASELSFDETVNI